MDSGAVGLPSACCALQIALLMIDEVHLLGEVGRGSALEAGCVCRLKAIAAFPEMAQVGPARCHAWQL